MQGKQVVRVRTGEPVRRPGSAEGEALVVEFSDGSRMGIEAGAHIAQTSEGEAPGQEALRATCYVTYVPPMLPYRG
jgi:hypothetical protein